MWEGFQLSLRFEKNIFVVGEPITATVLLRNVSAENLEYYERFGLGRDFKISVVDEHGRMLSDRADYSRGKARRHTLFQGTQHKFSLRLDDKFSMNVAGDYVVSVTRQVPEQASRTLTEQVLTNLVTMPDGSTNPQIVRLQIPVHSDVYREISSGNAVIRIIDASSAAAGRKKSFQAPATDRPSGEVPVAVHAQLTNYLSEPSSESKQSGDFTKAGPLRLSASDEAGANSGIMKTGGPNSRHFMYGSTILLLLLALFAAFHKSRHRKAVSPK